MKAAVLCSPVFAVTLALAAAPAPRAAQLPEVRCFPAGSQDPDEQKITAAAESLRSAAQLLDVATVRRQLSRTECELTLPPIRTTKLAGRDIWRVALQSHVRVGWYCLCTTCEKWHLKMSGGYVITADGGVVTCQHVLRLDDKNVREGFLLAADDDGRTYPVAEILAANESADVAILRIPIEGLTPLPLNTDIAPGDDVWCYSEPLGYRGFFSHGIVNRLVFKGGGAADESPLMINVSAEWARGSSGSAVLDEYGNAIGHVSEISMGNRKEPGGRTGGGPFLVIRDAASAREVLKLVKAKL